MSAGDLDPFFGTGGKVITDFNGNFDSGQAVTARPSNVVPASTGLLLMRYNADGSLDTTFGDGGRVIRYGAGTEYAITAVALQPGGRILVGGSVTGSGPVATGDADFLLMRFNPDGTIDATFGAGGVVQTDFTTPQGHLVAISNDLAADLVLQADGKIILAGTAQRVAGAHGQSTFALA